MRNNKSTSSTGNILFLSNNQLITSKQKSKILPLANKFIYCSTWKAKPYNKYQFNDKIGQPASKIACLLNQKPELFSYNKAMTYKDSQL